MRIADLNARGLVGDLCDDRLGAALHYADMLETGPRHFLKEWRLHRRMTQQALADAVQPPTTKAVISNLELGDRGLSDKWLHRLAPALRTKPGFIIDHDPAELDTDVMEVWADVPADQREQALSILRTFAKKAA